MNNVISINKKKPNDMLADFQKQNIKFDINKLKSACNEILKTNLLFNSNISARINIDANKITSGIIFDKLKIFLNLNNGKVDIDNSLLNSKKVGKLEINYSSIYIKKNPLKGFIYIFFFFR